MSCHQEMSRSLSKRLKVRKAAESQVPTSRQKVPKRPKLAGETVRKRLALKSSGHFC